MVVQKVTKLQTSTQSPLTIVFCGSFKFYKEMEEVASPLRKAGYTVIVPLPSHIRHGHKPQLLKNEKYDKATLTKWEGEGAYVHLANIKKGDVVYFFNKGGYVGPAVTVEIGYSLALGKHMISKAKLKDITITNFIKAVVPSNKLVNYIKDLSL